MLINICLTIEFIEKTENYILVSCILARFDNIVSTNFLVVCIIKKRKGIVVLIYIALVVYMYNADFITAMYFFQSQQPKTNCSKAKIPP